MPTAENWNADNEAIWQEKIPSDDPGGFRTITLRHPTYPFVAQWTSQNTDDLTDIAAAYLRKVASLFGFPATLLADKGHHFASPHSAIPLTWLPIGVGDLPGPEASFWIRRYRGLPDKPVELDRTAILLAVQSFKANDPDQALGSRLGIRIIAHVSPGDKATVRITGATCSADLPRHVALHQELSASLTSFSSLIFTEQGRRLLKTQVSTLTELAPELLWIDGLRVRNARGASPEVAVYMKAEQPKDRLDVPAYALILRIAASNDPSTSPAPILSVERLPLFANCAEVTPELFQQDPASAGPTKHLLEVRPNRKSSAFEPYRHPTLLPGLALAPEGVRLADDLNQVMVMRSRLVDRDADESQAQVVQPADNRNVRTNTFAALSAYQHAREFFDTMRSYGLSPTAYFRLASLPLLVRYRSGIKPGPGADGKTVNARVDYQPTVHDQGTLWSQQMLGPLQVQFGLADTKRTLSRRESLGLACDPRWSWHEYGHVLIAASTGALELPFAHSVGDALAAILSDPDSKLVDDPVRMATFPWVYLNRRHDRSVGDGWSWCGSYHRPARLDADSAFRRKGYRSEQILSTSLFRLYRALGGDTIHADQPDRTTRQAAAHFTAYLIMRAIAWLGPAKYVSVETPDQFVSALIDADIATEPATGPPLLRRVGGCAHKVVRWAFEAQGLYAATDPLAIVDAPGSPPEIDIFIDNGRPNSEGTHPRGGYMPVSLGWSTAGEEDPSWHATRDAMVIENNQVLSVKVGNRGRATANDVRVRLSYAMWPSKPGGALPPHDPPLWNTPAWASFAMSDPQSVAAGQTAEFGPFPQFPARAPGVALLVLAHASCPGDSANTDAITMLPCSVEATPLVDLAAGDNNLGLRLLR